MPCPASAANRSCVKSPYIEAMGDQIIIVDQLIKYNYLVRSRWCYSAGRHLILDDFKKSTTVYSLLSKNEKLCLLIQLHGIGSFLHPFQLQWRLVNIVANSRALVRRPVAIRPTAILSYGQHNTGPYLQVFYSGSGQIIHYFAQLILS